MIHNKCHRQEINCNTYTAQTALDLLICANEHNNFYAR